MSVAERRDRAARQLARVGLSADRHKMPAMLSGGERQRVAIARAMTLDPDIILMDEPFSALDPNTRTRLRNQLVELWQGSGKTVVFVTHDVDEALFLAERIIVMCAKPARVVETVTVDAPRPRRIESDPNLRRQRRDLLELFATIEKTHVEETT
jgi:NitT/TauT family transport system ATP-binding protein